MNTGNGGTQPALTRSSVLSVAKGDTAFASASSSTMRDMGAGYVLRGDVLRLQLSADRPSSRSRRGSGCFAAA